MTSHYSRRRVLAGLAALPIMRHSATMPIVQRSADLFRRAEALVSPVALQGTRPGARVLPRQFGFFCDPYAPSIDKVAGTGVGGISLGPYFAEQRSSDANVGALSNASEGTIVGAMERAKGAGLRVTLKPMIDARAYPNGGGWRAYLSPSDPAAWFSDYWTRAIEPYLGASDSLIIYTELNSLSSTYPSRWRDLIAKVRAAGFTGPISSDADVSTTTTPWYGALDWLGGSFYPSIDVTSDRTARRGWRGVASQMAQAHGASGLPIFMGEVGVDGLSVAQQIRWIETMGDVLGPEPWWAGMSYWRWSQDPTNAMPVPVQKALAQLAQQWAHATPRAPAGTDPLTVTSARVVLDCEASSLPGRSGARVPRWRDRTASHHDLIAAATPPVIGTGFAYADEPFIHFAGPADGAMTSAVPLGASYTVVVAFTKPDPYPDDLTIIDFAGPGTWRLCTSRYGVAYYDNGSFLPFATAATKGTINPAGGGVGAHLWTIQVTSGSTVRTRLDGDDLGTFTLPRATFAPTGVGVGGSTARVSPGVAAVVALSGVPSEHDLAAIENWVGSTCGISL